jgi:hypothetical protein
MADFLAVTESQTPQCPRCGKSQWLVHQRLEQASDLVRVDALSDLVVVKPDEVNIQSLALKCRVCDLVCVPQAGVTAYYEGGGEDHDRMPPEVENNSEYSKLKIEEELQ